MKDPEPTGGPSSDPQEPTKNQQEETIIGALTAESPTLLNSQSSLALHISATHQWGVSWKIDGSFTVDGNLSNSQTCCVTGDPDSLDFEDATGITLGLVGRTFEVAIVAHQQVEGRSRTQVSTCNPSTPDFIEEATIDVTMEWQFTLLGRLTLLDLNYGGVEFQLGLEVGGSASQIELGEGKSSSTSFNVDHTLNTLGAYFGPFLSFNAHLGGIQCRSVASLSLGSFGDGYSAESSYSLSLGLGVEF